MVLRLLPGYYPATLEDRRGRFEDRFATRVSLTEISTHF